jgi:transposase
MRYPDACTNGCANLRSILGTRDGVTSEERDPIKALEREVKELRRANEILKLASAFFARAELDRRLKS